MPFSLFSNLIDTLGRVVGEADQTPDPPAGKREEFLEVMGETYQMITATLLMVIIRLKDILLLDDDFAFMDEVERLSQFDGWYEVERQFRLCQGLRRMYRELEAYRDQWVDDSRQSDWEHLLGIMQSIFATETEVAGFLSDKLWDFSEEARQKTPEEMRRRVKALRAILMEERRALLEQESSLYDVG